MSTVQFSPSQPGQHSTANTSAISAKDTINFEGPDFNFLGSIRGALLGNSLPSMFVLRLYNTVLLVKVTGSNFYNIDFIAIIIGEIACMTLSK